MEWKKLQIPIENIPICMAQLKKNITDGNPIIEDMRCVFRTKDDTIVHTLMPYDFVDLDPKPEIAQFYLYQAFRN